ncbi:C25 family cysteine peptidase [Spirosoma panaciterrae]|uniref:putative type IX secretion system sortase PorU2 n=1 Tax=Spirosoma panaciterrae TaxID=496058 RepID=UPI0003740C53|nr:C25 family cysteine peptidase [Spirosoma panaciterrae]
MKQGLLFLVFTIHWFALYGQRTFGSEWINPSQKYLKFSTNQTGIYRITYDDLKSADASFLQTNPASWQLFFRGKETAIRIVGQQDGTFDAQDYLEFYGEGNDGSQDSLLYRPQKRLHPYQTLFSDKTAYFLTSSPGQTGKRVAEQNSSAQGLTAEKFHVEEAVRAYTSDYTFNNLKGIEPVLQLSYFEPGEGWSGPLLTTDSTGTVSMSLQNRVSTVSWPIVLEGMVNGRDNTDHRITVDAGNVAQINPLLISGFASQTFQTTINPSGLQNEQVTLRFKSQKIDNTNNFSITYVKVSYPQATDMAGQSNKVFHLPPNAQSTSLLAIKNAPAGAIAYDITDKANCRFLVLQTASGQPQAVVTGMNQKRDVYVSSQFLKPLSIQTARFSTNFPSSATYLVVTHSSLKQSASTYAAYRASDAGGKHIPFIVDADSLYDQFNYGERSPLALRRFADYMLANTAVKNMLLIGKACSYPYYVKTAPDDLVPTIGYPGSDILLTAGLGGYPVNTPAIPTGRLNVTTNEQVLAYLDKIKQVENPTQNGLWRKHLIHISGGKTKDEAQRLSSSLAGFGTIATNGLLGGQVSVFSKTTTAEVETINISPLVNDGVGLITFFGHSGPNITDMNFGYASPPDNGLHNSSFPFMIFNGCGAGEIFSRFNTLSTDWLLAPSKGAAVVLAHSYWSFEGPTAYYLNNLYTSLFTDASTLGMPFGKVQQQLNTTIQKGAYGPYDESILLEMVLQGDPAVSLYPLPNPDFSIDSKGLYIQSSVVGSSIKSSDSIQVVMPLANLGKFVAGQSVVVSVKKTASTGGATTNTLRFNAFRYQDTVRYTIVKDPGLQKIEVIIDPANQITELSKTNNSATLTIDWSQAESGNSYPIKALPDRINPEINVFIDGAIRQNRSVVGLSPRVDVFILDENPLSRQDTSAVDVYLRSCETCAPQKIPAQLLSVSAVSANQLQVTTHLSLKAGGTYQLIVFGKDAAGNRISSPYRLDLVTLSNEETITVNTYPNPATSYVKFELNLNVNDLPVESRLIIYNQSGVQVFNSFVPVSTGKNLLLWQGVSAGIYPYSLRLTWKDGRTDERTGKVIWQP